MGRSQARTASPRFWPNSKVNGSMPSGPVQVPVVLVGEDLPGKPITLAPPMRKSIPSS